jgi:hypothetical protein
LLFGKKQLKSKASQGFFSLLLLHHHKNKLSLLSIDLVRKENKRCKMFLGTKHKKFSVFIQKGGAFCPQVFSLGFFFQTNNKHDQLPFACWTAGGF